jgi:AcrR family transcriptional regulator
MVERILDAAARIFDDVGYHATTTNHVADLAEVSIGSLYQYFRNKDALLVGLAERHLDEALPQVAELAARLREEQPEIERYCDALVRAVADVNRSDRLHQLLWRAPRTDALHDRLAAFDAMAIDEVAWHLERFGHPSAAVRRRARLLVTTIGAAVHDLDPDDDIDAQIDELAGLCAVYVAAGVEQRSSGRVRARPPRHRAK